jgi:hypothetical protein
MATTVFGHGRSINLGQSGASKWQGWGCLDARWWPQTAGVGVRRVGMYATSGLTSADDAPVDVCPTSTPPGVPRGWRPPKITSNHARGEQSEERDHFRGIVILRYL